MRVTNSIRLCSFIPGMLRSISIPLSDHVEILALRWVHSKIYIMLPVSWDYFNNCLLVVAQVGMYSTFCPVCIKVGLSAFLGCWFGFFFCYQCQQSLVV